MTGERVERRLAAILAADVAGYSRLMGADEEGTLAHLKASRKAVVDPAIAEHKGRIVKTTGDGMLVEFASSVDAVTCAIAIQEKMAEPSTSGGNARIVFRIGINVGDIIIDGNDIFGDGVNVAARVENECEPGGVYVSGNAFEQIRGKTNFTFDDLGERALKNIERPVRLYAVRGATSAATTTTAAVSVMPSDNSRLLPLPDRPSIAVLPFQNMSGDPEQEYFADGMVEDIITALSRFKQLFVIARNSSFTYKGKAIDIKQVGRELGVRYVLEGSVRKAAGKVRITGQLIDAATGAHLWADKIDGSLEDIFELQDRVTSSVVGAIAPRLDQAEMERVGRKSPENLDAYDCLLRGLACTRVAGDQEKSEEALRLFYRAIELDPQLASAYAGAAIRYNVRKLNGWIIDKEREFAEARRLAEMSVRLGQDDATALSRAAVVFSFVFLEYDKASALVDSAIAINPNLALAWSVRGWVSVYLGQHEKALEQFDRAVRLNPVDPENSAVYAGRAFALVFLGKYEEACYWAEQALARQPKLTPALRPACAGYALAGRLDEARDMLRRIREIDPTLLLHSREFMPFRRPEDVARMLEGYRLAGLPV